MFTWYIFRSRNHHIPVKSLALLLESARRDENYTLAAEVSAIHTYMCQEAKNLLF